jgi:hypothetical protein
MSFSEISCILATEFQAFNPNVPVVNSNNGIIVRHATETSFLGRVCPQFITCDSTFLQASDCATMAAEILCGRVLSGCLSPDSQYFRLDEHYGTYLHRRTWYFLKLMGTVSVSVGSSFLVDRIAGKDGIHGEKAWQS